MRSPRDVFLELVNGVCERRWAELPELYAERTHVEHPFAPLGVEPLRTREDLRRHFEAGSRSLTDLRRRPENVIIHETTDPEVIVAEFEYRTEPDGTGEPPLTIPCIFVLRVRDGEIVESRDYIDHIRSARARGGLSDLLAALAAGG